MSKKAAVILVAILLLTIGSRQAKPMSAQSDWIVFSPKGGGFSIMLPGEPKRREFPHGTSKGQTLSPLYELTHEDFKYVVSYMNYPISVEGAERDKLLSMGAEAGITSAGGEVVSNTPISLDGYPGREVKGEMKGFSYRSRVYLVGQRLYLLIVWLPSNKTDSENAAKFFNSFKLVAQQ
jgi:hypothetical protein